MVDDFDDCWTLRAADRALLGNKSGATRLGFAVLLKLFAAEGRFPRRPEDVPLAAVEAIAAQVGVPAAAWRGYAWQGRTIEYHRAQVRSALGFREATLDDAEALGRWLDGKVLALERRHDRLIAVARERCRALQLEPPSPDRLDRLVRSVLRQHEEAFCAAVLTRLSPETTAGLDALLRVPAPVTDGAADAASDKADREPPLLALRAGTGPARLHSVDEEAAKLRTIRALALPADLFDGVPARVLTAYRRRVGVEELHELRRHPAPIRLTLLDWAPGSHTVTVNFLNDAWDGSPATDRNLYLDGATYDGAFVPRVAQELQVSGPASFGVADSTPTPSGSTAITIGSSSDALVLDVSQDAYQGNARFTVSLDGGTVAGLGVRRRLPLAGKGH